MKQRGRPKKADYVTRDPATKKRDPTTVDRDPIAQACNEERERVVRNRQFRRYIPANMPTVCPTCGGNTRMADGKHTDPVRRTVLEYRTCAHCGLKLAAGRPMTAHEIKKHCEHIDAVAEYEQDISRAERW